MIRQPRDDRRDHDPHRTACRRQAFDRLQTPRGRRAARLHPAGESGVQRGHGYPRLRQTRLPHLPQYVHVRRRRRHHPRSQGRTRRRRTRRSRCIDDLYDGLKEEIEEGTSTSCSERGWAPYERRDHPDRGAGRRHDHRRQRLPRRHPVRARGADGRQRDEGRHGDPEAAAGRNRRAAHRQDGDRHRQGRHPRHRQEPRVDDDGRRGFEVVDLGINNPVENYLEALETKSPTSSACRRC
jgi:hypothetical protein